MEELQRTTRTNTDWFLTSDYTKRQARSSCELAFIVALSNYYELEVVVHTEANFAAKVEAERLSALVITLKFLVLVTEETKVSNEAQLVIQVDSNTRLQTKLPNIVLHFTPLDVLVTETTIDEDVHHVELHSSVTNIWRNSESLNLVIVSNTINLRLVLS